MMPEILMGVFMAALGHLAHLIKKVVEERQAGANIGLTEYIRSRPYRTALGVCGSAIAMGFMVESGHITAMGAVAIGYMSDSGLALLGKEKA